MKVVGKSYSGLPGRQYLDSKFVRKYLQVRYVPAVAARNSIVWYV